MIDGATTTSWLLDGVRTIFDDSLTDEFFRPETVKIEDIRDKVLAEATEWSRDMEHDLTRGKHHEEMADHYYEALDTVAGLARVWWTQARQRGDGEQMERMDQLLEVVMKGRQI